MRPHLEMRSETKQTRNETASYVEGRDVFDTSTVDSPVHDGWGFAGAGHFCSLECAYRWARGELIAIAARGRASWIEERVLEIIEAGQLDRATEIARTIYQAGVRAGRLQAKKGSKGET